MKNRNRKTRYGLAGLSIAAGVAAFLLLTTTTTTSHSVAVNRAQPETVVAYQGVTLPPTLAFGVVNGSKPIDQLGQLSSDRTYVGVPVILVASTDEGTGVFGASVPKAIKVAPVAPLVTGSMIQGTSMYEDVLKVVLTKPSPIIYLNSPLLPGATSPGQVFVKNQQSAWTLTPTAAGTYTIPLTMGSHKSHLILTAVPAPSRVNWTLTEPTMQMGASLSVPTNARVTPGMGVVERLNINLNDQRVNATYRTGIKGTQMTLPHPMTVNTRGTITQTVTTVGVSPAQFYANYNASEMDNVDPNVMITSTVASTASRHNPLWLILGAAGALLALVPFRRRNRNNGGDEGDGDGNAA